jgi:hypothetical protein
MGSETVWGLGSLILIVAFILYALWQGSRVKKPPHGMATDRSVELTIWGDPR